MNEYCQEILSQKQLDSLREALNIGAGNAATALSQILQCMVSMTIPAVRYGTRSELASIVRDPAMTVTCVRTEIIGDLTGRLSFLVPDADRVRLLNLAAMASPGWDSGEAAEDLSIVTEVGNILAGVYLTAIHELCGLRIYHTVPSLVQGTTQSLCDESAATMYSEGQLLTVAETEFVIHEHHLRPFIVVMLSESDTRILVRSLRLQDLSEKKAGRAER